MTTLSERLKLARKQAKLTQSVIAERVGITQPTYQALESGKVEKTAYFSQIAKVLGVSTDWLATGQGEMTAKPTIDELRAKIAQIEQKDKADTPAKSQILSMSKPTPVISWVRAGSWSENNAVTLDDADDWLPRPLGLSERGFALQVRGESMLPEFRPGDYIYVEPEVVAIALKNGDLVVVQKLDGTQSEATFKQLVIGETADDMYLKPLNPNWHEQKMLPLNDEWHLVGKVVGKYVKY